MESTRIHCNESQKIQITRFGVQLDAHGVIRYFIRYQPEFIRIQPPTANRPDARGAGCWHVDTVLSIGAVLGTFFDSVAILLISGLTRTSQYFVNG